MNKLKRFLALVLAMSMMLTAVPFGVFAAEAPTTNLSTTGSPFQAGTGGSNSFRIPAMVTLSDGTLVAAADARWNTTYDGGGLDTMVAISTDNGGTWTHSFANYLGDNGNSYNYNSTCFIDPSLAVKKANGVETIYMLCDLYPYGVALNGNGSQTAPKYDTGFNDSGYLALSADNHGSYSYYLDGTTIKDADGDAVEGLTVDEHFNVTGTYNGTAYDTNLFFSDSPFKVARTGFLYLTKSTDKGATWSAPQLLNLKTGNEMVCLVGPGRGLVTENGTIMFPVYSYDGDTRKYTGLVYSSDGTNWTRSENFTDEISSEATLVELDSGAIRVFFRNERSQLAYSDFNTTLGFGNTVATGVAVNSDTELSAIKYSKTVDGKQVILVSAPAGPNAAGSNNNNGVYRSSGKIFCGIVGDDTLSTMTWKTGSVAVTDVVGEFSGSTYENGFFAYSCLTELNNNSVSILYEDSQQGWGVDCAYTMAYKNYTESDLQKAFGVTFDGNTPEVETTTVDVTMKVGDEKIYTIDGVALNGTHTDSVATVTWTGTAATVTYATATLGSTTSFGETTIDAADCLYTFTETSDGVWEITGTTSDGTTVYFYPGNSKNGTTDKSSGYPNCLAANLPDGLEVYVLEGAESGSVYLKSNTNVWGNPAWVQFDRDAYRWNRVENVNSTTYQTDGSLYLYRAATANETSSTEIPGYVKVASYADVVSDGKYLIAAPGADGATYIAYPSTTTTTLYNQIAKVTGETASSGTAATPTTTVTITGNAPGNTKVEVGNTTYNITVTDPNAVYVELEVGDTATYTIDGVALTGSNTDTSVATVTWTGSTTETTIAKATVLSNSSEVDLSKCLFTFTDDDDDGYYVIESASVAGRYLNNIMADSSSMVPFSATAGKVQITTGYFDEMFQLKFNAVTGSTYNGTPTLHFHTEQATPYWNRCGTDTSIKCHEYIYRAAKAGEESSEEIPGYVRVTSVDEITSGDQYLIAQTNGTNYYVLYPGTSQYECVAKVTAGETTTTASTTVTITGNAVGKTTVKIGDYNYYITVTDPNVVYVNLEVGETLTYTDTTGNYVGSDSIEYPNETTATMTLAPGKALKLVTTLESGKQYLIVNKVTGAVLTDTEMKVTGDWGNKDGLATTGSASADSKELWTITSVDGGYTVEQGGKYLAVAGFEAHMYDTSVPLTLSHTLDGWLIYDYTTGPALGHADAGYYLTDNAGSNYVNGALGTSDTTNTYRYWDIYEIVEANTEICFTGNAVGTTTAKVGSTTYYITVEEYILDDEINDTTNGYTVNAELQRSRYNELINGVAKDLYTDESWPQYEAARKTAYAKLGEVDGTTYATEAEAQAAIAELVAAMDALEAAKAKLVAAETITIHYQLDGTTVLTAEYKVAADATTLTLPEVLVVDKQTYTISEDQSSDDEDEQITITDGVLTLPENDTVVYVAVEKGDVLGNGFVASGDISADGDYVGTGAQIADLVKDDGTAMKITEMTLTTGFSYDLDLADSLADGQTVEWSSDNSDVATVDQDGNVTAVAEGTANVTAVVKDANGNVVSVNSIPVTVFTSATTDRVAAVYIEEIIDTTVYCVVNADTDAKAFEVIEGELIYGKFDTTVDDGTATTAFSFFGDPDEAHALVAMTSTNSFGDYYLLHDDDGNLGIGTEYYRLPDNTTGAGYWQAIGLTDNNHDGAADWTKIEAMINWAIANGCDGGMGFTRRQGEGNIGTNLTFISDPMPTIEKEVYGVLPTSRKMADFRLYTDGMVAAVNELVYFKLTVTLECPTTFTDDAKTLSAITYDEAYVSDTILKDAYLYTKALDQADGVYDGEIDEAYRVQIREITDELNAAWGANETVRTVEMYLLYKIQESDIPKFYIDNIAYLNYDYESHYSTGAQTGAADAEARISVVGTAIDNVVIDFGQSFTYEGHEYTSITDGSTYTFEGLSNVHLKGAYVEGENDIAGITASKATAKYGEVKVYRTATGELDDKGYPEYTYTVTYTPTQILQGVDTVLIYGVGENDREKIINGFMVYPATTVYYEEGFILNAASTWSSAGSAKATVNQTFELLGDSQFNVHGELTGKVSNKKHAYGFDPIYDGNGNDDVVKSSISSNTIGDKTSFTFTGNGFEIFADCTTSSGAVSVQVRNAAGKVVKVFNVNTIVAEENAKTGDATDGQDRDLDSLPIVSWHTEIHGTYTVTVTKVVDNKPVTIDGVRIFNTLDESEYATEEGTANSPFAIDLEDAPEFYQLRDYVLHAIKVDENTTEDYTPKDGIDRLTEQILGQISGDSEAPTAVVLANHEYDDDAQNLLDNGPKNELYLHQHETLVFKVQTKRAMQIGLKAPGASTTYSLEYKVGDATTTVANNKALNTSVDLFYELGNAIGTEQTYTITITNHGSELLSVTDLKICDDPNAAFVALDAEDIKTALTVMGYSESCEDNHSFENGFCIVCGMGSVRNTTTGVEYGTIGEALAVAKDGEIVILLTDCTESTAMVASGVTLDLNGFKLTASYAVAMDGAHIIDSTGNGSLVIGEKALILDEENAMIPVYNGEGYVFTKAGFAVRQDTAYTGEGIKINAMAYPVQMAVVDLLKNGGADNNIEIVIRLTWDTDQGTGSQDFKFTDEVVSSVYSSNQGAWNKYSKMFSMVVTGFESIENLKANIIVASGTDAEYVSSTSVDIT